MAVPRGKLVLPASWATSREGTLAPVLHLKSVQDTSGRDGRLALIGLSLDVDPETARCYAALHRMDRDRQHLDHGDSSKPVAAALGVRWPPRVRLIGPDGKVVAKDLEGERIERAVAEPLVRE